MMIKDYLRSSIALDIIKKTKDRIGEDSSVTLYPFTRTLKIVEVEAQSLGIFPIMFSCPTRKDKYT